MTDQKIVDAIVAYNRARWEELVAADVLYSRPYLDLDLDRARAFVDAHGIMGDVAGKDVLCLAGGGGQQSAAFGLLGARTTVFDLTAGQLDKDRQVAAHYGLELTIVQGDMRDLSVFADRSFDIVYHAFSISFVPDVRPVFSEVARVLRPDGLYRTHWSNPFVVGIDEREWDGRAYPLNRPYRDGEEPHLQRRSLGIRACRRHGGSGARTQRVSPHPQPRGQYPGRVGFLDPGSLGRDHDRNRP